MTRPQTLRAVLVAVPMLALAACHEERAPASGAYAGHDDCLARTGSEEFCGSAAAAPPKAAPAPKAPIALPMPPPPARRAETPNPSDALRLISVSGQDGSLTAVILIGGQDVAVRVGDALPGRLRVQAVSSDGVTLTDEGGRSVRLFAAPSLPPKPVASRAVPADLVAPAAPPKPIAPPQASGWWGGGGWWGGR